MEFSIDSLVSYDKMKENPDDVFGVVDKKGKILLIKDNQPAYIIAKYDPAHSSGTVMLEKPVSNLTLHEAMKQVLSEAENHTMHASELADEIYDERLYLQKNGGKAKYNQIRARCSHYPDMFEVLPGNYIRLKQPKTQRDQA